MSHAILPAKDAFGSTLGKLVGREVKAKSTATPSLPPAGSAYLGTYDDGAGNLEGVWLSDLAATASLAACLTLIPAGVANESIKAKKLSADLDDNAREIANISANSFGGKRVRLVEFVPPNGKVPPGVEALLAKKAQLIEFAVEVAGYVGGKVWFVGHEKPAEA